MLWNVLSKNIKMYVILYIRENYLIRPPLEGNGAYWNMNPDESETSMGQAQIVYNIYRNSVRFHQGLLDYIPDIPDVR